MKFGAINLKGEKVIGVGVALSYEDCKSWLDSNESYKDLRKTYGTSLSYLFDDRLDWVDGSEFQASNFEVVWTESIEISK